MRKILPALLFFVFVIPSFATPAALSLRLAIMKDGRRIGDKVVDYGIYKIDNKWKGHWNDAGFYKSPDGNSSSCILYHYSTKEGTLKNIKVISNQITFDLEPFPNAFGEFAKVIIKPPGKDYPLTPIVRVIYVDPTGVTERIVTERIILPSPEIWGDQNPSVWKPRK